ncbi:MAG: DNA repair protein RecO [Pseudomonadota bacterium]|nr:DNA repair protein RecO [Pseudomonadota bacterium]
MDWQDEGIVLSARPHGEADAIVELLTRVHGRHLGLVRGGRSRRQRPVLQPGNLVAAEWRARLSEHLGHYTVDLVEARAALILDDRRALADLNSLSALAHLLPERDPHESLFEIARIVLEHMAEPDLWPGLLVRWELELLNELGFGLDLSACAATGSRERLEFVSPKSGRAVSVEAAAPYRDKLLPLPAFLRAGAQATPGEDDVSAGFDLTGYFLEKHVWGPRGMGCPEVRQRLLEELRSRARGGGDRKTGTA